MTRAKGKSHYRRFQGGVLVLCKCSFCEELHLVKFKTAPSVMPRIYCSAHEYMRTLDAVGFDYDRNEQTRRRATA